MMKDYLSPMGLSSLPRHAVVDDSLKLRCNATSDAEIPGHDTPQGA